MSALIERSLAGGCALCDAYPRSRSFYRDPGQCSQKHDEGIDIPCIKYSAHGKVLQLRILDFHPDSAVTIELRSHVRERLVIEDELVLQPRESLAKIDRYRRREGAALIHTHLVTCFDALHLIGYTAVA